MRQLFILICLTIAVNVAIVNNYYEAQEINIASMAIQAELTRLKENDNFESISKDIAKSYKLNPKTIALIRNKYNDKSIEAYAFMRGKGVNTGKRYILVSIYAHDIFQILSKAKQEKGDFNSNVAKLLNKSNKKGWTYVVEINFHMPNLIYGRFTNGWSLSNTKAVGMAIVKETYECGLTTKHIER